MRTLLTWLAQSSSAAAEEYQWDGESKGESWRGRCTRGTLEKNIGCAYPMLTSLGLLLKSENITRIVSLRESKKVISV